MPSIVATYVYASSSDQKHKSEADLQFCCNWLHLSCQINFHCWGFPNQNFAPLSYMERFEGETKARQSFCDGWKSIGTDGHVQGRKLQTYNTLNSVGYLYQISNFSLMFNLVHFSSQFYQTLNLAFPLVIRGIILQQVRRYVKN